MNLTGQNLTAGLRLLLILLVPGNLSASEAKGADPSDEFFRSRVPRMEIRLDARAVNSLRHDPRTYVLATVVEGGITYTNVSVKLKGARGSFRHFDDQPALTLNFSRAAKGQRFHGLQKLHLNNSVQDWTMMNEMIASDLFLAAGVPTARATHAVLQINDRRLGLYVLKEGYDRTFLKRHFSSPDGNLYDGGFLMDVDSPLEKDEGADPENRNDLAALTRAAWERDATIRLQRLETLLDVDRFLTFAAIEMMLCDWDGYVEKSNNYRLYFDPTDGRAVFIPHGKDQLFEWSGFPIVPGGGGLVARQLLAIPEMRERYLDRFGQVMEEHFTPGRLTNSVNRIVDRLRAELAADLPRQVDQIALQAGSVKQRVLARARDVREEFAHQPRPLKFDAEGRAELAHWESRTESGPATVQELGDPARLLIRSGNADKTVASWRSRGYLTAGRYLFTARVTTSNVRPWENNLGAGAGLRISGSAQTMSSRVSGSVKDHELQLHFRIDQPRNVELVAELRATTGEAVFDRDSMRLQRLP
ncbi:MAG TPA: hypothetical protein DCY13_11285 [Verrucomicrobiales bacterium]|nr:hypothetical protein [Verrucomicrobiales bacterium]